MYERWQPSVPGWLGDFGCGGLAASAMATKVRSAAAAAIGPRSRRGTCVCIHAFGPGRKNAWLRRSSDRRRGAPSDAPGGRGRRSPGKRRGALDHSGVPDLPAPVELGLRPVQPRLGGDRSRPGVDRARVAGRRARPRRDAPPHRVPAARARPGPRGTSARPRGGVPPHVLPAGSRVVGGPPRSRRPSDLGNHTAAAGGHVPAAGARARARRAAGDPPSLAAARMAPVPAARAGSRRARRARLDPPVGVGAGQRPSGTGP